MWLLCPLHLSQVASTLMLLGHCGGNGNHGWCIQSLYLWKRMMDMISVPMVLVQPHSRPGQLGALTKGQV